MPDIWIDIGLKKWYWSASSTD